MPERRSEVPGEGMVNPNQGHGLVDRIFPLHSPRSKAVGEQMDYIRGMFTHLAHDVAEYTPPGPDQTLAIRALHDAMQKAIGNIANNQQETT
jgi:hypothetical protein